MAIEARRPNRKKPTGKVIKREFEDSFDKELAYTVTGDFKNIGTSQINFLLVRLVSQKSSSVQIKNVRFGNNNNTQTILRIWSMPNIVAPGPGLIENSRIINRDTPRVADLLVTKNDGSMNISNRGTLLNIFVGDPNGQTIEVPVEYRLQLPSTGISRLLFTCQNGLANSPTHIDIDWVEIPE